MKVSFKSVFIISMLVISTQVLVSCGIEDYPIIYPIPQSNVQQVMNNRSVVRIPDDNSGTTFDHFAIYYKIYLSNSDQPSTTSDASYSTISSLLSSEHNAARSHIDSTSYVSVNMDSFFTGRGFYQINLDDHNLSQVLSSSVFGSTLEFDFPSRRAPTMTVGSSVYTLWRSTGNGRFSPQPDRRFVNSDELRNPANIDPEINADVVDIPGSGSGVKRYTYAAFYIVAVGINTATYSFIYSTPALIHVFQLPDRW